MVDNLEDQSTEALAQIRAIAAEQLANVEKLLSERRSVEKGAFTQSIKDSILNRGYTLEEILLPLLPAQPKGKAVEQGAPKKRTRRTKKEMLEAGEGSAESSTPESPRSSRITVWSDKDNPENTYTRGPFPTWYKEKMVSLGLDPNNGADKVTFRLNHLNMTSVDQE
jgi:hypothetical protein